MAIVLLSFVILALTTSEICATETIECGTIGNILELVTVRISRGEKTMRGEWPFLTALFLVKEDENVFFCGGSLISSKHVLTAAHCVQDKGKAEQLLPGNISVVLGAYNLTSKTEIGVQQRDVQQIYVHPEWNVYSEKYDADLAILFLKEAALLTDFIRPVCIPTEDTVMDGVIGSVVGWGRTEIETRPNTEFIKRAPVTALNSVHCLTEYPDVATISSTRTFCGQGADGNANKGDSGGGFYVENEEYVYVQRGIVSSLKTDLSGYVDPDLVVVYTNVAMFKNWIADTVRQSVGIIELNLKCSFGYGNLHRKYTCLLDNLNIRSDNVALVTFSGSHLSQKTDRDVEEIIFHNGIMLSIPPGIGQIFKDVKFMEILPNLHTKRIKRSDFKNLEKLVDLRIITNEIMILEYDCLRDLQQLEVFGIVNNGLKEIEEAAFETNIKLKKVYLQDNNVEILSRDLFRNNLLLELIDLRNNFLKIIHESTFETNIKLKKVFLQNNRLEILPRYLFQNNLFLEIINLKNNRLKVIESDFSSLKNIKQIYFYSNICIDAYYEGDDPEIYVKQIRNLTELHNLISANCSSPSP